MGEQRPIVSLAETPFLFDAGLPDNSLDAMPYFHTGIWHVFHMQSGGGIGHRVSRDLVHWETRPTALIGRVATGSVVEHAGQFYFFYTKDQTVHLATSDDLDAWQQHEGNPLVMPDPSRYIAANFRDPFVFFHPDEGCWWMLVGTQTIYLPWGRAGCVGWYVSDDLLHWEPRDPLWMPGDAWYADCPQLINHGGRWYLFYLQRRVQYRVAESPAGPWQRTARYDFLPQTAYAGSRMASDGRQWVSFPFFCGHHDRDEFGELLQGQAYAIPRQLIFHDDGAVTTRPPDALLAALQEKPAIEAQLLAGAHPITGTWNISPHGAAMRDGGGLLLLPEAPSDIYLEADVTLSTERMSTRVLFRLNDELSGGYELAMHAGEGLVSLRAITYWDTLPVLQTRGMALPIGEPFRIRLFVSGSCVEAFIDDTLSLSARIYQYLQGSLALECLDAPGIFTNIHMCRLGRSERDTP